MDLDAQVRAVLGEEGAQRYKRVGAILAIVGFVLIVTLIALPIFTVQYTNPRGVIEEESWTYFELQDDREVWENTLDKVNMSIVFFLLLSILGIVLFLEGSGRLDLRRFFRGHAEVKATTVYAVATALAFVGVIMMASIWAWTLSPRAWTYNGEEYDEDVTSMAGTIVTGLGLLVVLGLLFMVAHSVTLSAYKRGLAPDARAWGRIAVLVALVSMMGVLALEVGSVIVVDYSYEFGQPGDMYSFDITDPFTRLDIDTRAHLPDADESVERFDLYLTVMNWSLFLSILCALAATVGISALGQGANGRRVHIAIALPSATLLLSLVALIVGMLAYTQVEEVAVGLITVGPVPIDVIDVQGTSGPGLYVAIPVCILLVLASGLYVRSTGTRSILFALGMATPEVRETAQVDGAPEGARAPWTVSRNSILMIIGAFVLVAVVGSTYMLLSGGEGEADGEAQTVDIAYLEEFSLTFSVDSYLAEGDTENHLLRESFNDMFGDEATTHFVNGISLTLTWVDEDDRENPIATYENQPDMFGMDLHDEELTYVQGYNEGTNEHGSPGSITIDWISDGEFICWGNTSLDVRDTQTVVWDLGISVTIEMQQAGNLIAPRRPIAYTDSGNEYTLEVTIEGRFFQQD